MAIDTGPSKDALQKMKNKKSGAAGFNKDKKQVKKSSGKSRLAEVFKNMH